MSTKLLIFDGIDNTGKTGLIGSIVEEFPDIPVCAFPSKSLCESDIFKNVVNNPTYENKNIFLNNLMYEMKNTLYIHKNKKLVLIDRLMYSTLIYQGCSENFEYDRYVLQIYKNAFDNLGICFSDVYHFIFKYPLVPFDNSEKNESKKSYDSQQESLFLKLSLILKHANKHPNLKSKYLMNTYVFEEYKLWIVWNQKKYPSVKIIKDIQNERLKYIRENYLQVLLNI